MMDIEVKHQDYELVILRMARRIGDLEVQNAALSRTIDEMVEDIPVENLKNLDLEDTETKADG